MKVIDAKKVCVNRLKSRAFGSECGLFKRWVLELIGLPETAEVFA